MDTHNIKIRIPSNHYVGLKHGDSCSPLGEMIPEGTDQVTIRRKAKIDNWCKLSHGREPLKPITIDNFPIIGFKVYRWSCGNHRDNATIIWRIKDPRGFEIELSALALSYLLEDCTIENGEILEKCVWGRFDSWNVLIPTTSKLYSDAERNTSRLSKRVSLRNIKVGNHIVTLNGISGVYLGQQYFIVKKYYSRQDVEFTPKKYSVIGELDETGDAYCNIHLVPNLKISEVTRFDSLLLEECVRRVNDHVSHRKQIDGSIYAPIVGSTLQRIFNENTSTILQQIDSSMLDRYKDHDLVVKLDDGTFNLIQSYELRNSRPVLNFRPFDINKLSDNFTLGFSCHISQQITMNKLVQCQLFLMVKSIQTFEGYQHLIYM